MQETQKAPSKYLLLASAATLLAAAAQGAHAQSAASVGEVVVTGSRIARTGYTAPTPVTVATAEDLIAVTPTTLADGLNKLPQFASSISPRGNPQLQANSAEHGNILNLRGVGGNRVLILLDGLRVSPTTYKGAVDVDVLPELLVQRVDVVTAGASAVYGSDAVSGVVNFVLDKRFEGIKGVAQYGVSDQRDLDNNRFGLAVGKSLLDGRLHLVASAESLRQEGIDRGRRAFGDNASAAVGSVVGSTAIPGTAANPFVFITGGRNTALTFTGKILSAATASGAANPALANQQFLANGDIGPLVLGTRTGTATTNIGGSGYFTNGERTLLPPLRTDKFFARATFDFTDQITGYVQASYATGWTGFNTQARFIPGARIYSDNAFLTPQAASLVGPGGSLVVTELLMPLGPLTTKESDRSGIYSAGLTGKFGGSWSWRADYVHSHAKTLVWQVNQDQLKMWAAVDAVRDPSGNVVCRVSITNPGLYPGCVPFNALGGQPSAAALAYADAITWFRSSNKMDDLSFSVQGDVWDLPAGPLSIVLGAEYRKQSLNLVSNSNPATVQDYTGLRARCANVACTSVFSTNRFSHTNVGPAHGSSNVKEAFFEVAAPLLKDLPFVQSLELNAAGRYTDYSTSGGVKTWKVGGSWSPTEDLRFRVTRSHDIRAPTLFDLYAGVQSSSATFIDPHTGVNFSTRVFTSGNLELKPEIADTWAVGAVFRPRFLPGFSASIDWYDLKIRGAITQQSLADVVNECERSNGASPTCALITRPFPFSDRSAANFPTRVDIVTQNISSLATRGIDVDVSYRFDLGPGAMSLRGYLNWVDKLTQQTNSVSPVFDYAGYVSTNSTTYASYPKWKANLSAKYTLGGTDLVVQETIISKMHLGPTQIYAEPDVPTYYYTDVTLTQQLPRKGLEAFITVNNLFDKQPPFVASPSAPGTVYPTPAQTYDIAGRTYTAGVRFKF